MRGACATARNSADAKRPLVPHAPCRMPVDHFLSTSTPGSVAPHLPDDHQEEFDSPHTIDAIARELRALGHHVVLLGDGREFLEKVLGSI